MNTFEIKKSVTEDVSYVYGGAIDPELEELLKEINNE
jgi:hypothetical protein